MTETNVDWTHGCGLEMRSFGDILQKQEKWENKKDVKKADFWDMNADVSEIKLWMLFLNICYSVNKVSIFSYKCH